MELYLQCGHGMMEHCRHLIGRWVAGTAIHSPRDLESGQIHRLGSEIVSRGGRNLVDPQFYDPRATHHRLTDHDYWPDDFETSMLAGGDRLTDLLERLLRLNRAAEVDRFIVPGLYCERVDDDWLAMQDIVISEASRVVANMPRLATICLSGEVLRFEDQTEVLLNAAEGWDVHGFYIVPEHPGNQYLVEDPMWLGNLLILCSGLKLQEKEVIVGYSNHQMLCLSTAFVDAIASGTWLNVRSFTTGKFHERDEDATSRRATWYYCPQTLSEFKVVFLDIAHRFGSLEMLRPSSDFGSEYAEILFAGAQPTSTGYTEQQAHRHYLHCLRRQCFTASQGSYQEMHDSHLHMLDGVESILRSLHRFGILGQERDFMRIIDVNRAGLAVLNNARGFVLQRRR